MPANRPRGSLGGSQHFSRNPPVTPMSERQQLALLMQMTSQEETPQTVNVQSNTTMVSRGRDRNERGETALHVAAIKGDLEQLNKLLEQGVNPNVADFAGWTPLHEACNHGWFTIAQALVKAGANVNARGLDDDTPLHDAATNGQIKLVKFLVERGADPSFKNRKGKCPCDVAAPAVYNYLMAARDSSANQCVPQTGRLRDDKKTSSSSTAASADLKKPQEDMDAKASTSADDVYDFKTGKDTNAGAVEKNEQKDGDRGGGGGGGGGDTNSSNAAGSDETTTKRTIDMTEQPAEAEDDVKRKKRKDSDSVKENASGKTSSQTTSTRNVSGKATKPSASSNKSLTQKVGGNLDRKSPCASPKPSSSTANSQASSQTKSEGDAEGDEKASATESAGFSMKVPPLKIVIPQSGNNEGDSGGNRNGKTNSQRAHAALPYVVASNSNDSDKDATTSQCGSPSDQTKPDDKKSTNVNFSGALQEDRQTAPRVLRSSYRSGGGTGSVDRGSNNSSPQLQAAVPSPPSQQAATSDSSAQATTSTSSVSSAAASSSSQGGSQSGNEDPLAGTSNASSSNSQPQKEAPVELHPRKRKIKASKESHSSSSSSASATVSSNQQDNQESGTSEVHPHDQPVTNCYQMQLNIRKQIERRQKSLFPVQPKPPQGFKDYLMNRCTYALAGNTKEPVTTLPPSLPAPMKDLFTEQEHARYKLKMQHVVEKEKLVLAVEQEILRVHGRAARALANQAQPFSVCTILKDQEVYNVMTPEQEEKESSARSRYNGRLFLSWLQDVDDKWEKIKEGMLLRHQNEAESLHAVQKMDWEWQMKEHNLCDFKSQPFIDDTHVPLVHVSDDFDLLRA